MAVPTPTPVIGTTNPVYGTQITVNGQNISPLDPNYKAYYNQQYNTKY